MCQYCISYKKEMINEKGILVKNYCLRKRRIIEDTKALCLYWEIIKSDIPEVAWYPKTERIVKRKKKKRKYADVETNNESRRRESLSDRDDRAINSCGAGGFD